LLYRPTTFFPGVAMSKELADSDSEEGSSVSGGSTDSPDMSHWVEILTTIKEFKQEEEETDSEKIFHHGYKVSNEENVKQFLFTKFLLCISIFIRD
jgi:hypothetical protein